MARVFHSIMSFFVFYEVLLTVVGEKNTFNPFSLQLNKKTELENSELTKDEITENSLEEKMIEKRRLFNNEGDNNSPLTTERVSENNELLERRRNSFSESDNENETPNYQQRSDWEYRQKFAFPRKFGNFRNPAEFNLRQFFTDEIKSNQKYDREMSDVFERGSSIWNEERNFKQFSNPEEPRIIPNFKVRAPAETGDSEDNEYLKNRSSDGFDRRVSITALNDMEMRNEKNYNHENIRERHPLYVGHSSMNYYNRHPHSFWHPNFHKPEKELIINFNTECPTARQLNNKLVHKFIFAPKFPISAQHLQHEIPSVKQYPETSFISGPKVIPTYYV